MPFKVFIDGRHGTTGLKIDERLAARNDVTVLAIDEADRKDQAVKAQRINEADIVFLCLPDAAARESVALLAADNTRTRFLDASTAHRVAPDWTYGLPELSATQREAVCAARRIAVPGCHASAFILLVAPLVAAGLIAPDQRLSATSITGYSGGGKEMIASYQPEGGMLPEAMQSPRHYALGLTHKHLPEMRHYAGLDHAPLFAPVVGAFEQGLMVSVPLFPATLPGQPTPATLRAALAAHYAGSRFVRVMDDGGVEALGGFLPATACNGTNRAELFVLGHDEQVLLVARLDNLGKGASGAAIQCMNLMLGVDEATGLAA